MALTGLGGWGDPPDPVAARHLVRRALDLGIQLFVDERVREVLSPLGLQEVGCSMMPWDWEWDSDRSAEFVIERLRRGSIVCMHDGRPATEPAELSAPTREATVAAVGTILDAMDNRGLRSVTISELLLSD
jgi:peptidoglycan/xylan/chitin deacetylase (PgdA/CDA1 family)